MGIDKLAVHKSSAKQDWQTPPWLYELLNEEFNFGMDLFADSSNHLHPVYMSEKDNDCFTTDWSELINGDKCAFGNCPYSNKKPTTWDFVKLAYHWAYQVDWFCKVPNVLLLPARTDTIVWHECCMKGQIRFIKGRLNFYENGIEASAPAPFPSAVCIFDRNIKSGLGPTIDAKNHCYLEGL